MLSKNSVYWLKSFGICLLLMAVALDADVTGVVQEGQISPISHVVQHKNDLVSIEQLVAARQRAGHNSHEIERALSEVPHEQRRGMQFLIVNMPLEDLQNLTADFLLENCDLAYQAWEAAPWHDQISEAMFFDTILPYACINERRDAWRRDFHDRFSGLVRDAKTPGEAAAMLNNSMFKDVGVKYSTKRNKPDQSPYESMEIGMASCTGLSILLVDGCRSVGVPARFVGTPRWSDGSGNHSWVEIWDNGWHFTGAAEPTGDELDKAWFTGRASEASRDNPVNGIYAVTWRPTPLNFELPWLNENQKIYVVDVTDRYTTSAEQLPDGIARVRIRVLDSQTGERVPAQITVVDDAGTEVFSGQSKDERFDANDHLTARLPEGASYEVRAAGVSGSTVHQPMRVAHDQQLVTIQVDGQDSSDEVAGSSAGAVAALSQYLSAGGTDPADQDFSNVALTGAVTPAAARMLIRHHEQQIRANRSNEMEDRIIEHKGHQMPFWYTTYGDAPRGKRSLWISMHGGGGAPPRVNTGQWENQKRLYELEEGVYVAPRAPTDTWNLWHQGHIDPMFDRLIENMIVFEGVDPNRVYLTGYSAGGDGVFQLAPRMADRWAAAGMMAGHPNETQPDGLRNTAFTLHMGGKDSAYQRNQVARDWKGRLAKLKAEDPQGYDHWVEVHEEQGHWMDKKEVAGLQWMAQRQRQLRPSKIVWLQDDVVHPRFYWLANDNPQARQKIVAEIDGQTVRVLESGGADELRIRLDDEMIDLNQEITVVGPDDQVLFKGPVRRTIRTMAQTLAERGDPTGIFSGEILVELPQQASP